MNLFMETEKTGEGTWEECAWLVKFEMSIREADIEFRKAVWAGDKNLLSIRM